MTKKQTSVPWPRTIVCSACVTLMLLYLTPINTVPLTPSQCSTLLNQNNDDAYIGSKIEFSTTAIPFGFPRNPLSRELARALEHWARTGIDPPQRHLDLVTENRTDFAGKVSCDIRRLGRIVLECSAAENRSQDLRRELKRGALEIITKLGCEGVLALLGVARTRGSVLAFPPSLRLNLILMFYA